ncbi:hypothetical protein LHEH8_16590 [Lactobacillus helveticus]|uniref:Transposase n=1 Tax=Lactobacillus helveticus TaxID=1587 RepID=A0A8H9KHV4_LACHE|nr:hypothetical protein LHEH8_16590 [Lactobacillus helveticus]GFP00489.1 hypothetical protein LHEW6_03220 [Lactobacillus helveticus]GFP03753.1 hypothetical protein LHEY10_16820 [Lactobacillus helveticus]GFP05595.1 hypothetical protein LMG22465_16080 [Lactobacillus helveticus]
MLAKVCATATHAKASANAATNLTKIDLTCLLIDFIHSLLKLTFKKFIYLLMTMLIYYKVYMTAMLQNENGTLTIEKKLPFLSAFTDILVKFRVNYAN